MSPVCLLLFLALAGIAATTDRWLIAAALVVSGIACLAARRVLAGVLRRKGAQDGEEAGASQLRRWAAIVISMATAVVAGSAWALWTPATQPFLVGIVVLQLAVEGTCILLLTESLIPLLAPLAMSIGILLWTQRADWGALAAIAIAAWAVARSSEVHAQLFREGLKRDRESFRRKTELEKQIVLADEASLAKSRFLATISHEIRTPMNGVLGALDIVERSDLPEAAREWVRIASSSAKALLGLLNDVLDYSRLEADAVTVRSEAFDIAELAERCIELFKAEALTKSLVLNFDLAPGTPTRVLGDPLRLRQVLVNLLGNAVKFTRQGSVVLRAMAAVPLGQVTTGNSQLWFRFEVQDSGPGIDPGELGRIFEPFYRVASTERSFGGTGLGLAITQRLVTLLKGRAFATSEVGKGSNFVVELPMALAGEQAPEAGAAASTPATAAPESEADELSGVRVLIAEDNPVNRLIAVEILQAAGATTLEAEDGQEAVAAAKEKKPDVILMDLHMPVMGGLEATARLRQWETASTLPRVPVIALTANPLEGGKAASLPDGLDDYLAKPYGRFDLVAVVAKWARAPRPRV